MRWSNICNISQKKILSSFYKAECGVSLSLLLTKAMKHHFCQACQWQAEFRVTSIRRDLKGREGRQTSTGRSQESNEHLIFSCLNSWSQSGHYKVHDVPGDCILLHHQSSRSSEHRTFLSSCRLFHKLQSLSEAIVVQGLWPSSCPFESQSPPGLQLSCLVKEPTRLESPWKWIQVMPGMFHKHNSSRFHMRLLRTLNRKSTNHCCPVFRKEVAIPAGCTRPDFLSAIITFSNLLSPAPTSSHIKRLMTMS